MNQDNATRAAGSAGPACSSCVHFEQAKPYRWGLCKSPLPWWVESNSPAVHPDKNNAKDCDCYAPNAAGKPPAHAPDVSSANAEREVRT